jgi:hypothetical protein
MDLELRKKLQIALIVIALLAAGRAAFIFYSRSQPAAGRPQPTVINLTSDDYVTPSKIFPYDLKSAVKELAGKTVWVRTGNAVPFYRYDSGAHAVDLSHKLGLLAPLEKLQIQNVVLQRTSTPLAPGQVAVARKQIMAVFERQGRPGNFAAAIGNNVGNDFEFTANELFFFEDPHGLYKHWPADVWSAIDQHQARNGMNELQVSFALGDIAAATPGDYGNRSAQYRTGSGLVTVTFENNHATKVEPQAAHP